MRNAICSAWRTAGAPKNLPYLPKVSAIWLQTNVQGHDVADGAMPSFVQKGEGFVRW